MRGLLVSVFALLLTACSHYEPPSLHGAASMRVEVEVYKGPLASPITGQFAELVAVLSDATRDVSEWQDLAVRTRQQQCAGDKAGWDCEALRNAIYSSAEIVGAACYMINSPTLIETLGRAVYLPKKTCDRVQDGKDRQPLTTEQLAHLPKYQLLAKHNYLDVYYPKLQADIERCMKASASLGAQLRCQGDVISIAFDNLSAILNGAARRTADANIPRLPQDQAIRTLLVQYASMTGQYGERMHARITVMQRQMADPSGNRETRTLPVSDYLRDASRTDYIQLFDWLDAAGDGSAPRARTLSMPDRIRMAQRLTADEYWQKINEVYTSGQGDVAMAFIKDDLGNWDLKSFSNDPSDLLASYRKVTDAALKTAANLALKAGSGPAGQAAERISSAQKAAQMANQLAGGETPGAPATVGGMNVARLHERTAARIDAQKARFAAQEATLTAEVEKQKTAATELTNAKKDLDGKAAAATQKVTEATTALTDANKALADAKADGADAAAISARETAVTQAQTNLTEAQTAAKAAQADVDKNLADTETAKIAQKSAEARLAQLPKDAVDAVRATLDDHLAVVAALQDGIAGAAPTPGAPSP